MIDINLLEKSWFFESINLKSWEILFDEWQVDDNLYIIKSWELLIEKYTTNEKKETKLLAVLNQWEIFWEWALNNSEPKQVKISAKNNCELLKIEAKNDFEKFLAKNTKIWIQLLASIIDIWNKRLLESNFLITSSYEITKNISQINDFNNKNLFEIFDNLSKTINSKYILYFEKNPVLQDYLVFRYDTRNSWKLKDEIIKTDWNWLDFELIKQNQIDDSEKSYIQELVNKNEVVWYLVIWYGENNFDESHKKAIISISVSIAWFISQKQYFEENKKQDLYEI